MVNKMNNHPAAAVIDEHPMVVLHTASESPPPDLHFASSQICAQNG